MVNLKLHGPTLNFKVLVRQGHVTYSNISEFSELDDVWNNSNSNAL